MTPLGKFGAGKTLGQASGLPQIQAAFSGWMTAISLVKITQQVVDGFVKETSSQVPFQAVVQPLSPKAIALKPEGERAWAWLQIHIPADAPIKLNVNDRVMYNCQRYKVMARLDYSANNYIELHAVQDYI